MGWDSEHFKPNNNIFLNEKKTDEKLGPNNKFVRCAECNEVLGVASRTLYEIEGKNYCSECYSRKMTNLAVERDHFDLKQGNEEPQTNKNEEQALKPRMA